MTSGIPEEIEPNPYRRLAQRILLQAIKDYWKSHRVLSGEISGKEGTAESHKLNVRRWVENTSGTFNLCAAAFDRDIGELRGKVLKALDRIEKGEHYSVNGSYVRDDD